MSRLPTPGQDQNQWGQILNDFLAVEHNTDGSLKKAGDIVTAQNTANAKYTKPSGGIPAGDLTTAIQTSLTKADSSVQSVNAVFPSTGNVTLTATDVAAIPTSQKAAANGVASLDGGSKLTISQLPTSVATKAQVLSALARSSQRISVVHRAQPQLFGGGSGVSDGTVQGEMSQTMHKVLVDSHSLEVEYGNVVGNVAVNGIEEDGANDIKIYAALVEPVTNIIIPIGPVAGFTIAPGAYVRYEVPVELVAGQMLAIHTQVWVDTLGKRWPRSLRLGLTGDARLQNTNTTNGVNVTVATSKSTMDAQGGSGLTVLGPSRVSGTATTPSPSVLVIGNSIAWGTGKTTAPAGEEGFIDGWLKDNNVPYQSIVQPSSKAFQFVALDQRYRKMRTAQGLFFTHWIYQHGVNDLGATSLAAMKTNATAIWILLSKRTGATGYVCTCTPKTDSSGNTPGPSETDRTGYNDWLRAGAPLDPTAKTPVAIGTGGALLAGQTGHPVGQVVDAADTQETARNSGVWKTGYTTDGIHPTNTGHTAGRAIWDISMFPAPTTP